MASNYHAGRSCWKAASRSTRHLCMQTLEPVVAWGFLSLDGCSATLRYRPLLVMPIWTTIRFGELLRQSPFAFPRPCKASEPGRLLASLANVGVCDLKVRFPPKSGYRQGRLPTTLHGKSSGLRAIFQAKASSCEPGRGPSKDGFGHAKS